MRLGIRSTFGMALLGFAAIVLLGEILSLAYPVGTRTGNDANPSGTPQSWQAHATAFGVVAVLSAAGWWLMFGGRPKRNTPTHLRDRG
jgi:hypothetical protein